ncbi:uncharacterized protein C8Q71DRAFT_728332 [Rhodofomes roseus]|uniref:Uncharacterized protein n=1 Tax=Rhodofomes roseus TaxID=34475 RepID=A0ABQ8JXS2_9APHY|nr:uncharacterized protein C8Q71DRAFT_728332 [Rhodofomes roseus]KAH9829009.1 hypothetical protein C8Q71DRAFT_728332 [Rhodofomes roseus]
MVSGSGKSSRAQWECSKHAAACSVVARRTRQVASQSSHKPHKATAVQEVLQERDEARQETVATRKNARQSVHAADTAVWKAHRDKYNTTCSRDHLQAKLAERCINTGATSSSTVPAHAASAISQSLHALPVAPGSPIASLTPKQCERVAGSGVQQTNYNAEKMFAANDTSKSSFVRRHLSGSPGDLTYLWRLGQKPDSSRLGKKWATLMVAKEHRVQKKNVLIDGITPILDPEYWWNVDKCSITIEKDIKPQLYWHKRANPSAKIAVTGKKDVLLTTLLSAIDTYNEAHLTLPSVSDITDAPIPSLVLTSDDLSMYHNKSDSDCEYEEEELLHS